MRPAAGEFPSGQRGRAVNPLAPPSEVRILSPPFPTAWPRGNRMVAWVICARDAGNARGVPTRLPPDRLPPCSSTASSPTRSRKRWIVRHAHWSRDADGDAIERPTLGEFQHSLGPFSAVLAPVQSRIAGASTPRREAPLRASRRRRRRGRVAGSPQGHDTIQSSGRTLPYALPSIRAPGLGSSL